MGMPPGMSPPAIRSGGGLGRFMGMGFGVLMAVVIGGVVLAQNVFGIEIPIIGRFIGGRGGGGSAKRELDKIGVEYEAANPNDIIKGLKKRAKRWRKEAEFYSVSINGLKSDGTLDFSTGKATMVVEFFSPKLVGSTSKSNRKKSIRKYVINKYKVTEQVWGVKKRYPDVPGTPIPECQLTEVGELLEERGMKGKKTASVSLDPGFAFATDGLSFNINVTSPKLHLFVNIDSCEVIKEM
jgi:hypothetical protein